jgi:hypothetical protein
MTILLFSFFISWLLFVWFKTDAFVEYASGISFFERLFRVDVYKKALIQTGISYPDFLLRTFSQYFLIRLITCPVCLGTFLSVLASCFVSLKFFGVIVMCSLYIYFGLVKLSANNR